MEDFAPSPFEIDLRDVYLVRAHVREELKAAKYRGLRVMKLPNDLWNYQEIIYERKIDYVLETGTFAGGSALWFADTLAKRGGKKVFSVDIEQVNSLKHPFLELIESDSTSPEMLDGVFLEIDGPLLVVLDSDHSEFHVYHELKAIVPRMKSGDYLVVEDTLVNGHPIKENHGPGPWEAIERFKEEFPGVLIPDLGREFKFLATVSPNGYYIKA